MTAPATDLPLSHRVVACVVLLGVLAPVAVAFGTEWIHRDALAVPKGDLALIESATFAASRFERTLGPYSQFHFAHPGPLAFYVLAPFYRLAGMHSIGLHLGAASLAAGALVLVVVALARDALASPFRALVAGSTLILALVGFSREFVLGIAFSSPWNPTIAAFAILATAAASSAARAGDDRFLPIAVFSHALASQSHVTAVFAATPMLALALFSRGPRPRRGAVVTAASLAAIVWSPTLLDLVINRGGNLVAIVRFAIGDPRRELATDVDARVIEAVAWPLDGLARVFGPEVHADGVAIAMWALGLLLLAIDRRREARARGERVHVARLDVGFAGLFGALVVAPFLRGHPVAHLAYGIGMASTWLHLACMIMVPVARPRASLHALAAVGFVATIALASDVVHATRVASEARFPGERPATRRLDAIARCAARRGDVAIRTRGRASWVFGATAALAVLEQGRVPELHDRERFRSGEPFVYGASAGFGRRIRLSIDTSSDAPAPDARRIGRVSIRIDPPADGTPRAARAADCLDAR